MIIGMRHEQSEIRQMIATAMGVRDVRHDGMATIVGPSI